MGRRLADLALSATERSELTSLAKRRNTGQACEHVMWCLVAEALARCVVEAVGD